MSTWLTYPLHTNLLYTFPSFPAFLDFTEIHPEKTDDFALSCLQQLLDQESFKHELEANFNIQRQLEFVYFQQRNHERLKGGNAVAIGFPYFTAIKDNNTIFSPIVTWNLRLSPNPHRLNHWFLQYSASPPQANINESLLQWMENHFQVDLSGLRAHNDFSASGLLNLLRQLQDIVGFEWTEQLSIQACPSPAQLDEIPPNGKLFWSGVFGNLHQQAEFHTPDQNLQLTDLKPAEHALGLLSLNEQQTASCQLAMQHPLSLISGPAGSGKSYCLAHLATHALANGQKTLVLSTALPALKEIQQQLAPFDLYYLHYLLQSPENDRSSLLELLKAAAQNLEPTEAMDEAAYMRWLEKTNRLYQKYATPYREIHKAVFHGNSWTESVGVFLQNDRQAGKELLASQLNSTEFEFSPEEYPRLQQEIQTSQMAFQQVQTLQHPLNQLHPRVFTQMKQEDAFTFVKDKTEQLLDKTTRLHQRFIHKSQLYNDRLFRYYESQYQKLFQQKNKLLEVIAENRLQFEEDYFTASAATLRLKGIFSSRSKEIMAAKENTIEQFERIQLVHNQHELFEFNFPSEKESRDIRKIKQSLEAFAEALENWRQQIPTRVQEEMNRLNHKTVAPQLGFKDQIEELEQSLERLVEQINETEILKNPLKNQMLTIPKRLRHLEAITDRIENIQFNLRDFQAFYSWQRHWLSISATGQKVVKALIKVKATQWEAAFNSWYVNNALLRAYSPLLPGETMDYAEVSQLLAEGPNRLVPRIKTYWQHHKAEQLKALKRKDKRLFYQLFSKKNLELSLEQDWKQWFQDSIAALTDVIPVLFTSVEVITHNLQPEKPIFDYILVDEAQELNPATLFFLQQLGHRVVLAAEMPLLQTKPKLWQYLQESAAITPALRTIIEERPGDVLQQRTTEETGQPALFYEQVDGRFDENEKINEAEAQYVIHVLNQIQKTPQQTYPSTGIATFTVEQRNLILRYLHDIRRRDKQGAEKIKQLERNGLGVFHLSELHGQHFDIMIISTTFGAIDLQGNISKQIQEIDLPEGQKLLRILLSRARKQLFVANSIPKEKLHTFCQQTENPGRFLLANAYAYYEAASQQQADEQAQVQAKLQTVWPKPERALFGHTFAEEVAEALRPYLQEGRIKTNIFGEPYHFPILIEPENERFEAIVIKLDGCWLHQAYPDFQREVQYDEEVKKCGYHTLSIWSNSWWKSPEEEVRKLASTIIKIDQKNQQTLE